MIQDGKYVSEMVTKLRKRVKKETESDQERLKQIDDALDTGIAQFASKLQGGEIKMKNTLDLERLVKLRLLLMDKPTERVEHTSDVEEITEKEFENIENSKEFRKVQEQLADMMNKKNQEQNN